nr:uncharacterized protein LOC115256155 [Aedes albopictus]
METFMMLDKDDFTRLELSTKKIKLIQKIQRQYTDLIIEERLDETEDTGANTEKEEDDPTVEADVSTNPEDIYKSINLDQEINIDTILCKTETGRNLIERLKEGQNSNEKMITQISHILCDCLRAVYGERPSTFHKEMIAKSLVKTYPILGSAASDVPHVSKSSFYNHYNIVPY